MIRLLMMSLAVGAIAVPAASQSPRTPPEQGSRRAQSAYVQGSLNLAIGERVVLRPSADGAFELVEARFLGIDAALPPAAGSQTRFEDVFKAEPGTIALSLGARQDVGSFLKIENGLDRAFAYTGFIARYQGGRRREPARTSVCTVPAGKLGYEHWNEPVIQAVLANFSTRDDAAPVCESHDVNE